MNGHGFCKHGDQCPFSHEKIPNYEPTLIDIDASIQNEALLDEQELNFQNEIMISSDKDLSFNTLPSETVSPISTNTNSLRLWPSISLRTERILEQEVPLPSTIKTHEKAPLNGNPWGIKSSRSQISSILKKENDDGDDILKDINKSLIVNLFNDNKPKSQIVIDEKNTLSNKLIPEKLQNNSSSKIHPPHVINQPMISNKLIPEKLQNNTSSQIRSTNVINIQNNLENRISNLYITKNQEYPIFNFLNENNEQHNQNNIEIKHNINNNEGSKSTPPTKPVKSFLEVAQSSMNNNNKIENKVVKKQDILNNNNIDHKNIPSSETSNLVQQVETKKKQICAFFLEGNCRYKENCKYIHGNLCQYCKKHCLHPEDVEQNNKHIRTCALKQEIEDSKNFLCSLCNESVLKRGQKFGLLPECNDIFCVTCIKEYRTSSSKAECPVCSKVSHFIVPSHIYPANNQRKNEIIESYKDKMRKIPCKYFESGECKFGENCHYLHDISNANLIESNLFQDKIPNQPNKKK